MQSITQIQTRNLISVSSELTQASI